MTKDQGKIHCITTGAISTATFSSSPGMTKETLTDFLKTGTLRNVDFSFSRDKLKNIFGDTDWISFRNNRNRLPSIIKYGKIEFHFLDQSSNAPLWGIAFQFWTSEADNKNLECDYNSWNEQISLTQILEFLTAQKIQFSVTKNFECPIIVTGSGIQIWFDENAQLQTIWKYLKNNETLPQL